MKVFITQSMKNFLIQKDIPVPKVSFFNSHDCTYFAEWASENFYTYYDQTGIIHYLKIREEFGDSIFNYKLLKFNYNMITQNNNGKYFLYYHWIAFLDETDFLTFKMKFL